MIAHKYEYKDRQKPESGAIRVLPATHAHAQEMQQIACMSYNMAPEDWHYIDVEQYHSRIDIFPAGQFVALDGDTGQVIGFTSSMRIDYHPSAPLLDSWERTTGYG